jgi:predicted nucleic-acid-binding protein
MTNKIVDTSVVIRYLTEDDQDKADRAEKLFRDSKEGELEIPDIVFAEIVWVLESFYDLEKPKVLEKLKALLAFDKIAMNRSVLEKAIDTYALENVEFIDCYLAALASEGEKAVVSFDEDFDMIETVDRIDP